MDEEGFLLGVRSTHQWISKGGGQGRGDLKKISGFSELGSFSPSSSHRDLHVHRHYTAIIIEALNIS